MIKEKEEIQKFNTLYYKFDLLHCEKSLIILSFLIYISFMEIK